VGRLHVYKFYRNTFCVDNALPVDRQCLDRRHSLRQPYPFVPYACHPDAMVPAWTDPRQPTALSKMCLVPFSTADSKRQRRAEPSTEHVSFSLDADSSEDAA
jgi:hypothetical protein